ncbi:MAG: type II toxin-antitoxin system VapC family toxin [Candidatus Bathyarchaeia archaeon]|nr:type II toxin-antitoxin system VapC family toxin [Candidatus Bathyarchaeota archaeon]
MKMLDTSIVIGILRGDSEIKELVEKLKGEEVATTVLTYFEIFSRIYHRNLKREERIVRRMFRLMPILELDGVAADKAAEIMGRLLRIGKPINAIDVMISGIALANGVEELITKDEDFKVIEEVCDELKVNLLNHSVIGQ